MSGKWRISAALRGRRAPAVDNQPTPPTAPHLIDVGDVQVLAHTVIADLFGAGLRVQSIASRAPTDLEQELNEVADHIDSVIRELRTFAFEHRR